MNASSAEENLRAIRGLMERAAIYRAISYHAACFAGVLAIIVGLGMAYIKSSLPFVGVWIVVLVVCSLMNVYFLSKDAKRRGEPLFSQGMRLALRCMAPAALMGLIFTIVGLLFNGSPVAIVSPWLLWYGLMLLATQAFAPTSIIWLGWLFLLTSALFLLREIMTYGACQIGYDVTPDAYIVMACTFGLFHLIYGLIGLISNRMKAP